MQNSEGSHFGPEEERGEALIEEQTFGPFHSDRMVRLPRRSSCFLGLHEREREREREREKELKGGPTQQPPHPPPHPVPVKSLEDIEKKKARLTRKKSSRPNSVIQRERERERVTWPTEEATILSYTHIHIYSIYIRGGVDVGVLGEEASQGALSHSPPRTVGRKEVRERSLFLRRVEPRELRCAKLSGRPCYAACCMLDGGWECVAAFFLPSPAKETDGWRSGCCWGSERRKEGRKEGDRPTLSSFLLSFPLSFLRSSVVRLVVSQRSAVGAKIPPWKEDDD